MSFKKIFKETYRHLKAIEKNSRIAEFLKTSLDVISTQEPIYSLQKDFLIIEITYSYQHFGFSLFSKTSIQLIAKEFAKISGLKENTILNWLQISSDLITQDINIEEKNNQLKNENLERAFAYEFVKRIFCSEKYEDYLTGMSVFSNEIIENIRKISREKIAQITTKASNSMDNDSILENHEFFLDSFPAIKDSLFEFLYQLHSEPLSLLSWRLESFVSFIENENASIFLLRDNSHNKKSEAKKIMAMVSLLVPHQDQNGNLLLPNSPITVSQIARIFSPKFKSDRFQIDILKNWISFEQKLSLKEEIEILLEKGVEYGLFFKVPNRYGGYSYGLSDNGLKIIQPFQSVLNDTILKDTYALAE